MMPDHKEKQLSLYEIQNMWYSALPSDAEYCFGGFMVNLSSLKKQLGGKLEQTEYRTYLNNTMYVISPQNNPAKLSIAELCEADSPIDIMFDPLQSTNLTWNAIESVATRLDDPECARTFAQYASKLILSGNYDKQRELASLLQNKLKDYSSSWAHYRERYAYLWKTVFDLCLGSDFSIPNPTALDIPGDLLDQIFLSNSNNSGNYFRKVGKQFGETLGLPAKLRSIDSLLDIMEHAIKQRKSRKVSDTVVTISTRISTLISEIWPETNSRELLNNSICRPLHDQMMALDKQIIGDEKNCALKDIMNIASKEEQLNLIQKLREYTQAALEEWNRLRKDRKFTFVPITDSDSEELISELKAIWNINDEPDKDPTPTEEETPSAEVVADDAPIPATGETPPEQSCDA